MVFLLLIGIGILALGFFIYTKAPDRHVGGIFFALSLVLGLWVLSSTSADLAMSHGSALFWVRAAIVGPFFFGPLFLIFSFFFPSRSQSASVKTVLLVFLPILFVLPLVPTSFNVVRIIPQEGWTDYEPGHLYTVLLFWLVFYLGFGSYRLVKRMRSGDSREKAQVKYVLFGLLAVVIVGLITNLFLPTFGYGRASVFGPSASVLFLISISYAVLKYRLMDVRSAISRSIVFALIVTLFSAIFVFTFYFASLYFADNPSIQVFVLVLASFFIVLLLNPLRRLLGRLTDRIFFKASIDYNAALQAITDVINEEIEIESLISRVSLGIQSQLRIGFAHVLLSAGGSVFLSPMASEAGQADKSLLIDRPNVSDFLHGRNQKLVLIHEVDREIANRANEQERKLFTWLRDFMDKQQAYALLPISTEEVVGLDAIVLLSEKLSGEPYSKKDVELLELTAPQMASGLQKARLYQEQKEFGVKLQKEVEKATADLKDANSKLKELDTAKSEFMSIASHQLRTPLAGIMGYLSMITEGDYGRVPKSQAPVLEDVLQATRRLIRMVNIFLNATRIEAGRFVMNYKTIPFADVLEDIYKELKPTADAKGVELTYKKTELPDTEVDVDKIKDVVLNLVDNAIKYSPEGSVTLSGEATKNTVHVMVQDTGVGIPKDEVDNLFDKFVRGSGIANVEPNGSGLGLFIAKKITEGHGGRIWAESEGEGKGSTFQFEIPLKADRKAKKKTEEFKKRAKK